MAINITEKFFMYSVLKSVLHVDNNQLLYNVKIGREKIEMADLLPKMSVL